MASQYHQPRSYTKESSSKTWITSLFSPMFSLLSFSSIWFSFFCNDFSFINMALILSVHNVLGKYETLAQWMFRFNWSSGNQYWTSQSLKQTQEVVLMALFPFRNTVSLTCVTINFQLQFKGNSVNTKSVLCSYVEPDV